MIRVVMVYLIMISSALAAGVEPSLCHDIRQDEKQLVPAELAPWGKYEHVVQFCPAYAADGNFVWWIATLRLDHAANDEFEDKILHPLNPDGFTYRGYPAPYILSKSGDILGRLSDAYPTPQPGSVEIRLSDWHGDFPYHIDIHVENAAVTGSYDAPSLRWNSQTHHYDQIGTGIRNQRQ